MSLLVLIWLYEVARLQSYYHFCAKVLCPLPRSGPHEIDAVLLRLPRSWRASDVAYVTRHHHKFYGGDHAQIPSYVAWNEFQALWIINIWISICVQALECCIHLSPILQCLSSVFVLLWNVVCIPYLYCISSNHRFNVYFQTAVWNVISLCQASTLPCQVWCSLCTLYYHVKPQLHHVKLQSGWVKHYSYHGKFSQHLCSFCTGINLHTYLCHVKAHLHAASVPHHRRIKAICAASMLHHSHVKPHPCRIRPRQCRVTLPGCIKRHPECQPQLLWSKEELVSGNRKSIYTMPFVSDLEYGVHLF